MESNVPSKSQIIDPDIVKNQAAYKRYAKLKDHPLINLPHRIIFTSDLTIKIDPVAHIHTIQKKIQYLPEPEKSQVLMRVKGVKLIWNKVMALRQQAFGLKKQPHHTSLVMGLLDERSAELIEYYGKMMSPADVHEIVTKKWGYEISYESLHQFRKLHQAVIDEKIKQFQADYSDIRLTHKKGRLEEYVEMYNSRKNKYRLTETRADAELMMKLLASIQKEVEGTSMRIDHHISGKISITIDYAVQQTVMQGMTINDIIIARVAARSQINPAFILSRLHDSFYAQHSGFRRPDSTLEEQEVVYPSSIVYNWNDIEKQHRMHGDTNIEEAKWQDVTEEESVLGSNVKSRLQQLLGLKNDSIASAKIRIQENINQ